VLPSSTPFAGTKPNTALLAASVVPVVRIVAVTAAI
jgi:hypothetical protein